MIEQQTPEIRAELEDLLEKNEYLTGKAYRAIQSGITDAKGLVAVGAGANTGAAWNLMVAIRAILDCEIPRSPSLALQTGRVIGGILRSNPGTSHETRTYLLELRDILETFASDERAQASETAAYESASNALVENLDRKDGVYVYTFPTYFRNPVKQDPERFWFKIGMTDRVVDLRIANQTRSTAMPEDPWVLRVYRSETLPNAQIENRFHRMLEAAGHSRTDARHGGKEWFATNLELLDEIAGLLELEIEQGSLPE